MPLLDSWPRIAAATALVLVAAPAAAEERPTTAGELVVVAPTPLRTGGVDPDKLPGVVESLGAERLARPGAPAITEGLQQIAGASLGDPQGSALTRDLDFRGFRASALQGTAQGLAVYMAGVRLNEAFGDTVNWDLVPETAVASADLLTGDPAFGLNALGGAVVLRMKTGFDRAGGAASLAGGRFGRAFATLEQSGKAGPVAVYVAAEAGRDAGWRLHSPSDYARAYADLGWRGAKGEAHLVLAAAHADAGVVGPTPAELLAQDPRAVFTSPQTTRNTAALVAANGSYALGGGWSLQGDAYLRRFNQHHLDGNAADVEGCSGRPTNPLFGTLCLQNDAFPAVIRPPAAAFQVLTAAGAPVGCPPLAPGATRPCDGIAYGTLDRTRTDARSLGAAAHAAYSGPLFGRANAFSAGVSLDDSRAVFTSNSTLGVIGPDLIVDPRAAVPGAGELVHTAGALAYSPVALRARTTYLGLYATDTWDLSGRLSLTLGARFNWARVRLTDLTGASPNLNGRHDFRRVNPAAGVAYRLGAGTLYGGYSEGDRAPTALELGCSDPLRPCLLENALVSDPPVKAVTSRTWELGLRGAPRALGGVIRWRLGVFQAENRNDILALASVVQGRGYYANVPKTRRRGGEASLDYEGVRGEAYLAVSHVEATYRFSGALPSNSPFADADGNVTVRPGDRIGGIPADRLKLGGEWRPAGPLTLGADLVAIGPQRLVGDEANQDRLLPGYLTVSARASWSLGRRAEIFGRVDNLFDSRRATYGAYFQPDALANVENSPLPQASDPRTLGPLAPRAVLLGVRARW